MNIFSIVCVELRRQSFYKLVSFLLSDLVMVLMFVQNVEFLFVNKEFVLVPLNNCF